MTPKPTEEPETMHQPLAWHPMYQNCPKCNQPLLAQGTKNFNKLLIMKCRKCGWKMNVEEIRKSLKKTTVPPTEEGE